MSNDNKNMIYTARDIEQYFTGKLSAQQMYEMEKAALDDPFLAEAMEGYEVMKGKDWKNHLAIVRKQITEAGSEAKIIPMHRSNRNWWKAAAAVLVIGSGAVLTYVLTKDNSAGKSSQPIAQTVPAADKDVVIKDNTVLSAETKNEQPAVAALPKKDTIVSGNLVAQNQITVHPDNVSSYKPETKAVTAYDRISDKVSADSVKLKAPVNPLFTNPASANSSGVVANNGLSSEKKETLYEVPKAKQNADNAGLFKSKNANAVAKKEQAVNNYFNAQVVGADNSPLPFTNISVKSENFGTYADVKGTFRLFSADTVLNVEVRSVGYLPRTFSLRSNQSMNKIILTEDETAISEQTIIGRKDTELARKSRRASVISDTMINVEPADGWDNYNTYVANNLVIPEDQLKSEFHGEVELIFDVRANGTISNIRVNKSMGEAYDEAAKKLIRQGPQWRVKKGKKTSVKVKVQF